MTRFVVTWYDEHGCNELEFNSFNNADNFAAGRSYHYGTATVVDRKNRISWTYENGKMV